MYHDGAVQAIRSYSTETKGGWFNLFMPNRYHPQRHNYILLT